MECLLGAGSEFRYLFKPIWRLAKELPQKELGDEKDYVVVSLQSFGIMTHSAKHKFPESLLFQVADCQAMSPPVSSICQLPA